MRAVSVRYSLAVLRVHPGILYRAPPIDGASPKMYVDGMFSPVGTSANLSRLEADFNSDMQWILDNEGQASLCSTRFRRMIEQYGGVDAAHRLLRPDRDLPPDTFGYLRKINRLDLTMEYYAAQDKYGPLFSEDERAIARWRLAAGD